MHELVVAVLEKRDLSRAGELFGVSDWNILSDLPAALRKLKDIFNAADYTSNQNSQNVVEICLSRITSAIRETGTIATYAPGLVDVLENCLQHSLKPSAGCREDLDTPHAKIASDVLSCLFLHYSEKCVMTVAIPVTVKVLQKGSKDLTKSVSSYLALAAIHNGRLLAQYVQPLLQSIIAGNYALLRVLTQIYPENREPFHACCSSLVSVLPQCDQTEKLSLLQLCSMMAQTKPELLVPHVSKFRSCLQTPNTCGAVLPLFLTFVTSGNSVILCDELSALKRAADSFGPQMLTTLIKILTAIAKSNRVVAQDVISYMILQCIKGDSHTLPALLREVENVAISYPEVVANFVPELERLTETSSQILKTQVTRIRDICDGKSSLSTLSSRGTSSEKISFITNSTNNNQHFCSFSNGGGGADNFSLNRNSPKLVIGSQNDNTTEFYPVKSRPLKSPKMPPPSPLSSVNGSSHRNSSPSPLSFSSTVSCAEKSSRRSTNYGNDRQERLRQIRETMLEPYLIPNNAAIVSSGDNSNNSQMPSTSSCSVVTNSRGGGVSNVISDRGGVTRNSRIVSVVGAHGFDLNDNNNCYKEALHLCDRPSPIVSHSSHSVGNNLSKMKSKSSGNLALPKRHHYHYYRQHNEQFLAAQRQLHYNNHNGALMKSQQDSVAHNGCHNAGLPKQSSVTSNGHHEKSPPREEQGDNAADSLNPSSAAPTYRPHVRTIWSPGSQSQTNSPAFRFYKKPFATDGSNSPNGFKHRSCTTISRNTICLQQSSQHCASPFRILNVQNSGDCPPSPSVLSRKLETTFNKDRSITTRTGSGNTLTVISSSAATASPTTIAVVSSFEPTGGVSNGGAAMGVTTPVPRLDNCVQQFPVVEEDTSPLTVAKRSEHEQEPHRTIVSIGQSLSLYGGGTNGLLSSLIRSSQDHNGSTEHLLDDVETMTLPNACTQIKIGVAPSVSEEQCEDADLQNSCSMLTRRPIKGDAVKQFCEKHLEKIRHFMLDLNTKYPIPCQCIVEEQRHKQRMRLHFMCQEGSQHCLHNANYFVLKTKIPHVWLHLMFLHLQAQTSYALSQFEESVSKLKVCWECIQNSATKQRSFSALVTASFPQYKEQELMLAELQTSRYFDVFAYNASTKKWSCFACNHPERVVNVLKHGGMPVIEGQLKEKKGRWKLFKRWRTRYFTLSNALLSYKGSLSGLHQLPAIDLRSVRTVKSVSSRKGRRSAIPKAFEIFTEDNCSYVLKAKDHKNAEEWFQCLQIAVAQAHREPEYNS